MYVTGAWGLLALRCRAYGHLGGTGSWAYTNEWGPSQEQSGSYELLEELCYQNGATSHTRRPVSHAQPGFLLLGLRNIIDRSFTK